MSPGRLFHFCRRCREDGGANLIEAALVIPILLLITFALFEFGIILYVQMALQNGVNQGARYAITRNVLSGMTREQSIKSIVKEETPSLRLTDAMISFSHMPLGGSTWTTGTGPANSVERVTVTYVYPIMSPAMQPFFNSSSVTIQVNSVMKNEGDPGL